MKDSVAKKIKKRLSRIRRAVVLLLIGVYIASYGVLSYKGGYIYHNKGGQDNRNTWYAAHCALPYIAFSGRQRVRITCTGWLFLPLMIVDQFVIHPTDYW